MSCIFLLNNKFLKISVVIINTLPLGLYLKSPVKIPTSAFVPANFCVKSLNFWLHKALTGAV